jgi:HSP20 family molecular chaperone IbpA
MLFDGVTFLKFKRFINAKLPITVIIFFLIAFILSVFLLTTRHDIKVPYPNDQLINDYPSIWVVFDGSDETITSRKRWIKELGDRVNKTFFDKYRATYEFKPEVSDAHRFLYPSLEELKINKDQIVDSLRNKSALNITNLSPDLLIEDFKVHDSNLGLVENDYQIADEEAATAQFVYIDSSYNKIFTVETSQSVKIRIRNLTLESWLKDEIVLFTTDPDCSESVFYKEDEWIDKCVVATITEDQVDSNASATFDFKINTDLKPGIYDRQYFHVAKLEDNILSKFRGVSLYLDLQLASPIESVTDKLDNIIRFSESMNTYLLNDNEITDVALLDMFNLDSLNILSDISKEDELFLDQDGYFVSKNKKYVLMEVRNINGINSIFELEKFNNDIRKAIKDTYTELKPEITKEQTDTEEFDVIVKFKSDKLDEYGLDFERVRNMLASELKDTDIVELSINGNLQEIRYEASPAVYNMLKGIPLINFNQTDTVFFTTGTTDKDRVEQMAKLKEIGVLYLGHIADLHKVDTLAQVIRKLSTSGENMISVVGAPIHVLNILNDLKFNVILLLILSISICFFINIITSRYLLPTLSLYLSNLMALVISIGGFSYYYNYLFFQDIFALSLAILLVFYISNYLLNTIVDLRMDRRHVSLFSIVESALKIERKYVLLFFSLALFFIIPLLLLDDVFFFRIAILFTAIIICSAVSTLVLFPALIYLTRKSDIFKRYQDLDSFLDFTFIGELYQRFKSMSFLLLILFIASLYPLYNHVLAVKLDLNFEKDAELLVAEKNLMLSFGFNPIYSTTFILPSNEAVKTVLNSSLESGLFVIGDSIFNYLPINQEEKIGLFNTLFKENDLAALYPERSNLSNDDLIKWRSSLSILNDDLSQLKNEAEEKPIYSSLRITEIDRAIDKVSSLITSLDQENNVLLRANEIDSILYQYKKVRYDNFKNLSEIKSPLSINDFNSETLNRYTQQSKYLVNMYPFGSIYTEMTRKRIADFVSNSGYPIIENSIFYISNIESGDLLLVTIFLLLIILLVSAFSLKSIPKLIIVLLSDVFYIFIHQSIYAFYNFTYSYLDIIIFYLLFILFNLFIITTLIVIDRDEGIIEIKLPYKTIIAPILTVIIIAILFITYQGKTFNYFGYKLLGDSALFFFYIFLVFPAVVNSIIGKHFIFIDENISKIKPKKIVDMFVDGSVGTFHKVRRIKEAISIKKIYGSFKQSYRDYKQNQELIKSGSIPKDQRINLFQLVHDFFAAFKPEESHVRKHAESMAQDIFERDKAKLKIIDQGERNIAEQLKKKDNLQKKSERKVDVEKKDSTSKYDFGHARYVPVHVFETDEDLTIEAEVGDINIYDIDVSIDNNILLIKNSSVYDGTPFERYVAIHVPIKEKEIDIDLVEHELIITAPKVLPENDDKSVDDSQSVQSKPEHNDLGLEKESIKREEQQEDISEPIAFDIDNEDPKSKLVQEYMTEDKSDEVISLDKESGIHKKTHHGMQYEIHSLDGGVRIVVHLNGVAVESVKMSLIRNNLHISNHESYTGHPFSFEISLDESIIHESITTHLDNGNLIIEGKYRPNFYQVSQIEDQTS